MAKSFLTPEQLANKAERDALQYKVTPYTQKGYQPDYYEIDKGTYDATKDYFSGGMVPVWAGESALRDYAGHNQSNAAQIGNGVVKGVGLAATTAIQGFTSIGGLIAGGVNWLFNGMDAKAFSIAYDNGINEAIDIFNKNMEEAFPNFYTNEQLNADALDPQNWFNANFLADKFLKNLGFTVGAIVGGVGVGRVSSATLKLLSRTLTTAKAAGTLKVVTNAIKAGQEFDKALAPVAKALSRVDATSTFLASTGAAAAEASIEAFGTKQEIMNQLVSEYKMANGVEPTEQELAEMDNIASGATNAQFGLNMGILWASNVLQFGRFLRGNAPEKTIWKEMKKNITTDVKDGVTTYAKREAFQPVTKFGKVMYGVGRPIVNIAKIGVPEALEEATQSVFSNAAMNYALAKYDNDGIDTIDNLVNSVAYGLNQTIGTKEGQESMLLGFITGMVSAPIGRKGKKAEKAMLEEQSNIAVAALNSTKLNPAMKQLLEGSYRGAKYTNDKNNALEEDDDFAIRNANHDIFKNWVQSRLAVADKKAALDEISEVEQLDKTELAKYLGITEEEAEKKINKGFFKELKGEVNRLSGHLDFVKKTYTVQALSELAKLQGKELTADEIQLLSKHVGKLQDAAYSARADYEDAVKRQKQLVSEVRTRPEIDNATFEAFVKEATAIAKSHPGQNASQEAVTAFMGKVTAFQNKINDKLLENRIESAEEASSVINKLIDIGRLEVSIEESAKFLTKLNNKDGVRGILKQFETISKTTNVGKADAQSKVEKVMKDVSDTLENDISALEQQKETATAEQLPEIEKQISEKAEIKRTIDGVPADGLVNDSILNEILSSEQISQESKNNISTAVEEVKTYEKQETTEKGQTSNILWNDQFWNKLALGYTYGLRKFISSEDKDKIDRYCSELTDKQLTEEVEYKILPRETGDNKEIFGKSKKGNKYEWNNKITFVIAAYHKGQIIGVIYPPNAILASKNNVQLDTATAAAEMISESFTEPAAVTNLSNSFALSAKLYGIAQKIYNGNGEVQDITNEVLAVTNPTAAKGQLNIAPYSPESTGRPLLSAVVNKPTFDFEGEPIIYSVTQQYNKETGGTTNVLKHISGKVDKLFGDSLDKRMKSLEDDRLTSRYWVFMRTPGSNDGFWVPLELPSIDNIADKAFQANIIQSISDALAIAEAESTKQQSDIATGVIEEFNSLMANMYIATEDGTRRLLVPNLAMVKGKVVINMMLTDYANKQPVLVSTIKPENITALRSAGMDVIDIILKEMNDNKIAAQVEGVPIPDSRNAFKVGLSKEDKTSAPVIIKLAYVNTDHVEGRNVELYLKPSAVVENKAVEAIKDAPAPVAVTPINATATVEKTELEKENELRETKYREIIDALKAVDLLLAAHFLLSNSRKGIQSEYGSDTTLLTNKLNIPFAEAERLVQQHLKKIKPEGWQLGDVYDTSLLDSRVNAILAGIDAESFALGQVATPVAPTTKGTAVQKVDWENIPSMFAAKPNRDGSFNAENIESTKNDRLSLYEIKVDTINPNKAYFIYVGKGQAAKESLMSPDAYITNVSLVENPDLVEPSSVYSIKPGELKRIGDKWVVVKKNEVKFGNGEDASTRFSNVGETIAAPIAKETKAAEELWYLNHEIGSKWSPDELGRLAEIEIIKYKDEETARKALRVINDALTYMGNTDMAGTDGFNMIERLTGEITRENPEVGFMQVENEAMTTETIDQRVENIRHMLPDWIDYKHLSMLMGKIQTSGNTVGAFMDTVVYLTETAPSGTEYHEAFHAVFRLLLTSQEQSELLEAARKQRGRIITISERNSFRASHPYLKGASKSRVDAAILEEELAEGFRKYKTGEKKSFLAKIVEFFKKLLGLGKSIRENYDTIKAFYDKIDKGEYSYYTQKHNNFTNRKGEPALSSIPAGSHKDGTSRFLTGTKARRLINTIASVYIQRKQSSTTNPDELLKTIIGEIQKTYLPNTIKTSLAEQGVTMDEGQFTLAMTYMSALNPLNNKSVSIIKKEVEKIESLLNIEYDDTFEDETSETGERSYEVRNENIGGFGSLTKEVRQYIALTEVTEPDDFGIMRTHAVDAVGVYNALSNILANTSQADIISKLKAVKDLYSPSTTAVINRILNDAPVELQFKFIQAMNKYKIKYWMLRFKDGVANFADANSKNLADNLMRRWNSQYLQNKTSDKSKELVKVFEALDRAHVNATNMTREECITTARSFATRFDKLSLDIPVGYIAVSLAKTSKNPDAKSLADMFPDVAAMNVDKNGQFTLVNIATTIKESGSLVPNKDAGRADYAYWKHIAENCLTFHEAMGDDNFMNVEGETVYTKVLGTYIIRKAYELNAGTLDAFKSLEDFKRFYPEIHDQDLLEITYDYLKDSPLVALRGNTYWKNRGDELMSDMKVWFVDGIREDKRDGLTWKSMTARDKSLFEISSVLATAHKETERTKDVSIAPLYLRILESAGTANIVNAPYNKKAITPDLSIDTDILQGCIALIKQEYNSIARTAKLPESPFKNLISGKFQSGLKFINAHILFDSAENEDAFVAAAKEGKPFEEVGFTEEQMKAFVTKALINDGVRVINGLVDMGIIKKERNAEGKVTLKNVLLPKLKLSNGRQLVDTNGVVDNTELYNFAINELINRTLVNQWFDGNPAYSFTTYENYIKRNKGANGGVNSYHPGEINIAHITEFETPVELKGKVHNVNRNDGQVYEKMSWKMWKMFSKGLPDNIFNIYMDIVTYDGDPDKGFSTADGVDKTKKLEEFNMALNSDKDLCYDMYRYTKCSSFTLTREYTSVTSKAGSEAINAAASAFRDKWKKAPKSWEEFHDEFLPDLLAFERETSQYWVPRPGTAFEHSMLNDMILKDVSMVQPTSSTKRMVRNVSEVTETGANLIPQVEEAGTYGEQTPTPPGEDMTIDGTQKNTTVPTETKDNAAAHEYKTKLGLRTAATLEVAMAILRDVDEQGRVKYSMRKLLDGIIETLATTGADPQLISFFSVDANGKPVYDFNNLPSTRKQAAKFFMAHFNKVVLKQKTAGAKRILKSDAGVQIMEVAQDIAYKGATIKKGTILQAYQFDKMVRDGVEIEVGKHITLRDLSYDKLDEVAGVRYAEILIPSHDARAYNLKPGDVIPADLAEAYGVRIPTQDKASMMVYRVVGFMPSYYSKVAIFPKEIVLLKGADFDVDKEFMNLLATYKILTEAGKTEQKIYGRYKDATPTTSEQYDEYYSYYKRHKIIRHVIVDKLSVNEDYRTLLDELAKIEAEIKDIKEIDKGDPELPGLYDIRNSRRKSIELVEKATFEEVMKELQLPATLSEFATEAKARKVGADYNPVINVPDVLNNEMMGIASKLLTGSEDAFDKVLTPMNTDISDAALAKINEIRGEETGKMQSCHSFADIMTGFKLVALGSSNIGVVARAGMTIKLLAQLGVKLEENFAIEFEGKVLDKFVFESRNKDKVRVGTETNENITMQVDAIKGLMPVKLNLTQNILGVVVTMSGLGMGLQNALYFANSRVIRDLTMKAANMRSAIKTGDEKGNFEDFVDKYTAEYAANNRGFKLFKGSLTSKELLIAVGNREQAAAQGISKEEYAGIQMHLLLMLSKLLKVSEYARKVGDVQALHKGSLSSFTDVRKLNKTIEELTTDEAPPFDVTPILSDPYISQLVKAFRKETMASKDMFIQMQDKFVSFLDDIVSSFNPFVGNVPDNMTKLEDNILTFLTTTKFKRLLISSGLKGIVPRTQDRFVRALDAIVKNAGIKDAPNTVHDAVLALGKADPGNRFISFMASEKSKFDVTTDSRVRLHPEMVESIIADFNTLYAGGSKGNEAVKDYATQLVAFLLLKSGMNFVNESYVKFLPAVTQRPLSEASTAVMEDKQIEGIGVRTPLWEFMHLVTKDKEIDYWMQDVLVPKTGSILSKTVLLGTTIPKYLSLEVSEGIMQNIPIEGKSAGTSKPILFINLNTLKNASYDGTGDQVALRQAADLYNSHVNTSLLSSSSTTFPLVIKSHGEDTNGKKTDKKTYMLYAVGRNATKDNPYAGIVMATQAQTAKQLHGSVAIYVETNSSTMLGDTFSPYSAAYENMLGRDVYSKEQPSTAPSVINQSVTTASEIYLLLGNQTISENVKIVSNPNDYLTEQYNNSAVVAYKGAKLPQSFENPFHINTKATTKENVISFIDFVLNSDEPQAKWIREQAQSGRFKGKPIYYGNTRATKENQPSHATALDYLINKYDWGTFVQMQPTKTTSAQLELKLESGFDGAVTPPIVSPLTSETDESVKAAAKSAEETAEKCFGEGIANDAPPKLPENFDEGGESFLTY